MWDSCLENGDVATLACVPIVIQNVITAALVFSGLIALIIIIYSGIRYMTSKGDQTVVDSAKKSMTYAIIGLVVIFLSFFIVSLISNITGVDQIANPTL
jgi:hypothetical protein